MIRAAVAADRDALIAVLRSDATFRADEVAVAIELIDGALDGDPDYVVLIAAAGDAGDAVRGYVCFGATPMTRASWDLYWVVVHADARGRGIARGLLAAMEAEIRARGGRQVRVETSPAEAHGAARAMYARLGYPIVAELADFYAAGEGMILYYKQLAAG